MFHQINTVKLKTLLSFSLNGALSTELVAKSVNPDELFTSGCRHRRQLLATFSIVGAAKGTV